MLPHHQKFFRFLQRQRDLIQSGTHEQQTPEWTSLDASHVQARIEQLHNAFLDPTAKDYDGQMTVRIGKALPAIFKQEVDSLSLVMEGNLLYDYYTVSLGTHLTYPQVAKYVELLSHKNPNLEFLEIGAGTGVKSYTYTDISTGFFPQAQRKFAEWKQSMIFKKLDIEQDPEAQGYTLGRYDVILAANVLHATYDVSQTLTNVRKLLKPGGKLVLLEMSHPLLASFMPFGTLSGWWNCKEDWRLDGPLLTESRWREALSTSGFSEPVVSTPDREDALNECSRLIVATSDLHTASTSGMVSSLAKAVDGKVVLIKSEAHSLEQDELCSGLAASLQSLDFDVAALGVRGLDDEMLKGAVCISMMDFSGITLGSIAESDFSALRRITNHSSGLIWLSKGSGEGTCPEASIVPGLARSIRTEQPDFPYITIDFSRDKPLASSEKAAIVRKVFSRRFGKTQSQDIDDDEFFERSGILHVKRMIEDTGFSEYVANFNESTMLRSHRTLIPIFVK